MPITEQQIEQFSRAGAVVIRDAFASTWLRDLARGMERNFAAPSSYATRYSAADAPGGFYDDYCNWRDITEYRAFIEGSPAAEIAGRLLRASEVRIYHEHVLIKEPGTQEVTPWHHDLTYYGVDGDQVCSIWLPLDPVPRSACPEFVAGSHRWGKRFVPRMFIDHDAYGSVPQGYEPVPDIDAERDRHNLLAWDLSPGDCIVFHMLTLHGAPNTANLTTRRRGFSVRWLGDDAVFATRPWQTSPPFPEVQLRPGDAMEHTSFPVVWRADS